MRAKGFDEALSVALKLNMCSCSQGLGFRLIYAVTQSKIIL